MTEKQIHLDFNIHLIQQLRLVHAIAESAFPVAVQQNQLYKFDYLREKFSFHLSTDIRKDSKLLSEIITVNHKKPFTGIEDIRKPLIFPHGICSYCKTLWKDSRNMKFSFIGLATRERKRFIEKWVNEQKVEKDRNSILSPFRNLREKFKLRMGKMSHRKFGELHVFSSRKGREYPTKAWDENYYELLAQTQFVLCPRGKSDWTYRFFEAILCGAIPIVEKNCEVYSGFKFHQVHESIENFSWTQENAERNYELCLERITIPLPILNEILESQFAQKT